MLRGTIRACRQLSPSLYNDSYRPVGMIWLRQAILTSAEAP